MPRRIAFTVATAAALAIGAIGALDAWRTLRESSTPRALAPVGGSWIPTLQADVFVRSWGPPGGRPLLLVHGTGASSGTWFDVPQALVAAGWRVHAPDLPPFGLSAPDAGARTDYSRIAQAERVLAVLRWIGRDGVTVVAHSFGAGPALEAAIRQPARVGRLVLVAPELGLGDRGEPPSCEAAPSVPPALRHRAVRTWLVGSSATLPPLTGLALGAFVHRRESVTDTQLAAYRVPLSRQGFSAAAGDWALAFARAACEPAASLSGDQVARWARTGPTVDLIWGERDTVTPLAQAATLQAWMPGARLLTIPQVGHIPHIEDPPAFQAALLELLRAPRAR